MKKKLINFSFLLTALSFAATFLINIQIAKNYMEVDGKTRALFSLTELLSYDYQYYVVIFGLAALILALFSTAPKNKKLIAAIFAVLAIAFVFARAWRLFI